MIVTTTILCAYVAWPGFAQAFELTRERTVNGASTVEVIYGITSLPRERCDAKRLLTLIREHWSIENKLHYVRDVTFGEDACRVRKGSAAQVLAGIRNAALSLLRRLKPKSMAAATRRLAARPAEAVALLKGEN